jgi:hypothetical protein
MDAISTENSEARLGFDEADEAEDDGLPPLLARVRDGAVGVVSAYPRASLVGAFAVGFLLARLVRKLGEELS